MKTELESILTLRDTDGNLVAFWLNDMKHRKIVMMSATELGLEQIKDIMNSITKEDVKA